MEVKRTGDILEIGERLRIEPGPRRVTAVATEELLDNSQTAEHYALLINDTPEGVDPRPGLDALGQVIELGKEMTYLDWTGVQNGTEGARVFYLYELDEMTEEEIALRTPEDGEPPADTTIWRGLGFYDTEEAAMSAALSRGE